MNPQQTMNTQRPYASNPVMGAQAGGAQPLANGMMPSGYTAQGQYAQNKPMYPPQSSYGTAPTQSSYGTAPTYGQPPMQQPPYASAPPANYSQQAGGPMMGGAPMGGMGAPMMGGMGPMGGMGAPMMGGMGPMGGGMGGSVSLVKGGNMSLSKAVPNLRQVKVGLGWDVRQTPGAPFDLDASVFLLKGDGRVRMPQDLIFYNNRQSVDGSVYHHGDNLTGVGEGDDEQVSCDLTRIPPEVQRIVCIVSIYEAEARMQNFGMVQRAFIRVTNAENNQEIVRFDLTEEASMFNCMVFGELYRYNGEWKFKAIGQGVPGGLRACGPMFGVSMS